MVFRLLYLVALIGAVGGDARHGAGDDSRNTVGGDTQNATGVSNEEVRLGGEGFGNIVMLFVVVGALVLLAIVAIAMLGLSGQFENELTDPAA